MPADGAWPTVAAFLDDRTGDPTGLRERLAAGEVLLQNGTVVTEATPYAPGQRVYLHRDVPEEAVVPGEVLLLHQDENLVVVDKPHFLATMPRGAHVRQSAVLLLRQRLGLPDLAPAHRLDRLTAGVLVLTARREVRGAYQRLFSDRAVRKEYRAVAPVRPGLELPRTVRSRIIKRRGEWQATEEPGEVNAVTEVGLLASDGDHGLYRLQPSTGRTHQLRVHLSSLGIPIDDDPLYPEVRQVAPDDFERPLQLLASHLSFTDPLTGGMRCFTSTRTLDRWTTGWPR